MDPLPAPAQVFIPGVASPGAAPVPIGVYSTEADAWNVLRAFLAGAAETEFVRARIQVWEVDHVGDDAHIELVEINRRPCPICDERTFWIEGEEVQARCYNSLCNAWIEENAYEPGRWDCGWPSANWVKRSDTYSQAFDRLVEMRAQSNSAGTEATMSSTEEWLADKQAERQGIQQKVVEAKLAELSGEDDEAA